MKLPAEPLRHPWMVWPLVSDGLVWLEVEDWLEGEDWLGCVEELELPVCATTHSEHNSRKADRMRDFLMCFLLLTVRVRGWDRVCPHRK